MDTSSKNNNMAMEFVMPTTFAELASLFWVDRASKADGARTPEKVLASIKITKAELQSLLTTTQMAVTDPVNPVQWPVMPASKPLLAC